MILFLDSSALVKLYVFEPGTELVRAEAAAADEILAAMVSYAEARAALAALYRAGRLPRAAYLAGKRALEADWLGLRKVAVTEAVCREAGDMAERFGLRGYDSIQLACYATVARAARSEPVQFGCFDGKLVHAARRWRAAARPA